MRKIFTIAKYTLKENKSNKIFSGILYFGILFIFFALLMDKITLYENGRVVKDMGLFLTEFLIMLIMIYTSSTYLIRSIKDKSIYLILTKSVSRYKYIIGVNIGMIFTIFVNILFMGLILGVILFFEKAFSREFIYALFFIGLKLSMISSVGLLFSIISESAIFSTIFTTFVYILGHSVMEIKTLAEHSVNPVMSSILTVLYIILPKFNLLNYRDYLVNINMNFITMILYVVVYITCVIAITTLIFRKKNL